MPLRARDKAGYCLAAYRGDPCGSKSNCDEVCAFCLSDIEAKPKAGRVAESDELAPGKNAGAGAERLLVLLL